MKLKESGRYDGGGHYWNTCGIMFPHICDHCESQRSKRKGKTCCSPNETTRAVTKCPNYIKKRGL